MNMTTVMVIHTCIIGVRSICVSYVFLVCTLRFERVSHEYTQQYEMSHVTQHYVETSVGFKTPYDIVDVVVVL